MKSVSGRLNYEKIICGIAAWFYLNGIIFHLFFYSKKIAEIITPVILFVFGIAFLYFEIRRNNRFFLLWLIATGISVFFIEVIGVKTGIFFGSYRYVSGLGLKILDVPILISLNWIIVIYGSILIARQIFSNIFFVLFFSAFLTVLFDFFMEPCAVYLGYWEWEQGIIPLYNYITWFFVSLFFSGLYNFINKTKLVKKEKNYSGIKFYFFVQFIFFIVLFIKLKIN